MSMVHAFAERLVNTTKLLAYKPVYRKTPLISGRLHYHKTYDKAIKDDVALQGHLDQLISKCSLIGLIIIALLDRPFQRCTIRILSNNHSAYPTSTM